MHVCRRWRPIIFQSPRRLNLQILCTKRDRFKRSLGIWPDFPIAIKHHDFRQDLIDQDDIIAALEHPDRVVCIWLNITGSNLEKMATALHKPFPVLTHLEIYSQDENLDLPSGFLGGSAPCLEQIILSQISFPALPTLLLSARNLVKLELHNISPTCYISPSAMVACLAEFPRLNTLHLDFTSVTDLLGQIHPPPITRVVLPALVVFNIDGASEYLEDLVAQIDCPELDYIHVEITNPVVDFQVTQLAKFLNRSVGSDSEMSPYYPTEVDLGSDSVTINMFCDPDLPYKVWKPQRRRATITIDYKLTDPQVSLIAEVVNRFSAILSTVVHLSLMSSLYHRFQGAADIDWLYLLHPFSAVQTLHVSSRPARYVIPALEDIPVERVTEVLPSLYLAFFDCYPIFLEIFVAARELSDFPVVVAYDLTEYINILEYCVSQLEDVTDSEPE